MVDAVVDGMVVSLRACHRQRVNILVGTLIGGVHRCQAVGQVDDLVQLSLLEQCAIALAVHLLHLPAYGRQHQQVLARRRVGQNLHALALGGHPGEVLVAAARMAHHLLAGRAVGVQVVVDQPRRVVALQGEHHPQRVAQVVLREVVHQGLAALVITAHHAAGQLHLRGVVEVDAGNVVVDALLAAVLIPAVVGEHVVVLHGLDGDTATHQSEREAAVIVALHEVALGIVDLLAVHQEVDTLHGDAGAVIHHVA